MHPPSDGRATQGQGRSLLRRGAPAATCSREGRVQVGESRVDLASVAVAVARVLRGRVSVAEADDEVQAQVVREWLSGRGLPEDVGEAHRELRQRVVQRVLSDLSADRRGKLAAHRRDLRDMSTARVVGNDGGGGNDTRERGERDVLDLVPGAYGSPSQVEAAVDAREAWRAATGPGAPVRASRGWSAADRTAVVLAAMSDVLSVGEAADALGVSHQAASQLAARMAEHLRARLDYVSLRVRLARTRP